MSWTEKGCVGSAGAVAADAADAPARHARPKARVKRSTDMVALLVEILLIILAPGF
jgi:hypothetical protein